MNYWNPTGWGPAAAPELQLEAINRYAQHLADLQNPALQALWQRIRTQEMAYLRWLQNSMAGRAGMGAPGMGASGRGMMGGGVESPEAEDPPPRFPQGAGVVPTEPHAPEHRGRVGQIVQVVTDEPFYSVDFGTGHPHKWYAESELRQAPAGLQAGQEIAE